MRQVPEQIKVVAVDVMGGGGHVVIYFSDDSVVLFQAHFLSEVRNHDHNIPLKADGDENLDPE